MFIEVIYLLIHSLIGLSAVGFFYDDKFHNLGLLEKIWSVTLVLSSSK